MLNTVRHQRIANAPSHRGLAGIGAPLAFLVALGLLDGCGGAANPPGWDPGDDGGAWGNLSSNEAGVPNTGRSSASSSGASSAGSSSGAWSTGSSSGSSSGGLSASSSSGASSSGGSSGGGNKTQDAAGPASSYADASRGTTTPSGGGDGGCPTSCTADTDCQSCTGAMTGYVWCCSALVGCYSSSACGLTSGSSSGGGGGGGEGSSGSSSGNGG